MTRYCTLAQAKAQIKSQSTTDDSVVFHLINIVSRRVDGLLSAPDKHKYPYFAPFVETRALKVFSHLVNSYEQTFDMQQYLLELTSVVTNGQTVTSNIQGYIPGYPPYTKLQLSNANYTWYTLDQSPPEGRSFPSPLFVSGIWGYHNDYANAWFVLDALQANVTNVATTIKVSNATNFSPGHLIKIDNEYMEVTAINTTPSPDELTVIRAKNSTTAVAHTSGKTISIWVISDDIVHAVAQQVGHFYAKRAAFTASQVTNAGMLQYPPDLTQELLNALVPYRSNA